MDKEIVRAFILDTTPIQGGRTLGKYLKYMRNGFILSGSSVLFMIGFVVFNTFNARTEWVIAFIVTLLAAPITGVMSVKRHKYLAQTHKVPTSSISKPRKDVYGAVFGTLGATIAIALGQSIDFSDNAELFLVVGTIFFIPVFAAFVFGFCAVQYKLHLIKKYCPDLKDVKAE